VIVGWIVKLIKRNRKGVQTEKFFAAEKRDEDAKHPPFSVPTGDKKKTEKKQGKQGTN